MKTISTLIAVSLFATLTASVHAEDTASAPMTPSAAKETVQQMTPQQKQAMKQQAQAKKLAWQQMSPEEKQAKKEAMRSRASQAHGSRRR